MHRNDVNTRAHRIVIFSSIAIEVVIAIESTSTSSDECKLSCNKKTSTIVITT